VEWERNTVSLSTRVLFRKRRIFQSDKWNSWSNARERDNAERMILLYARHLCALFRAFRSRRFGAVTKKDHGNKNQSSPRVHIPRSDMVRGYSVQAFRYTGYNPCARTHICTSNSSFFLSFSLSFSPFFLVPSDHRNQSSSERLNTLGWLSFLGETNSIEGHESTKNVRRRDLKRAFVAPDAFAMSDVYAWLCVSIKVIRNAMILITSMILCYITQFLDPFIKLSFDTHKSCVTQF